MRLAIIACAISLPETLCRFVEQSLGTDEVEVVKGHGRGFYLRFRFGSLTVRIVVEKPAISYIIETAKGGSSTWAGCSEKNVATTAVSGSRHSHRVQIGRLQHKPKSNGLLLQAGQVATALPHDLAIQRVSIDLVAVFQCKAGQCGPIGTL